jgi:hypothetical protein
MARDGAAAMSIWFGLRLSTRARGAAYVTLSGRRGGLQRVMSKCTAVIAGAL